MRKVSVYKCPVCGMRFKSLSGWGEHIERLHPDTIPDGYSVARYFYYVDTGKTHGSCVQCHKPTEWNETTGKYSRYCSDPNCKKKYCAEAKKRMVDKYGVPHLLNDPDQQRKMLASKSKPYKFRDGGSVLYLSSYEKDFLMTCEFVLGLKSKDIMGPSPHTYTYMYEGKQHFYIPDFYIPDLNLEIEIKDGGDNESHATHIVEYDRKTEKIKDEVMIKNPKVNYFKVVNKEYQDFYKFLLECKLAIDDDMVKRVEMELLPATEAVSGNGKIKMMAKSDFEKIPDSSTLHLTRDAYLARLKADPKVFDKISCYGLYDGKSYPVGFFSISNDTGCVELLVVDEKERRKGYGTTLLNYAFNNFGGKYLEVRKSNAPAIGLYEKYGLHVTDEYQGKTEAVYRMAPATEGVSVKAISELETPQDVYDFIKKNVSYAEFDKLMTPDEVLQKGKGSCHDQAQLAKELLGKIGKNVALHFFIALRPNDPVGGNTHTFVTYKEDNKIVWFETSWDGANGIRKYDSMNQLKSDLFKYHMKTSYGKKYPELEFEIVGNKVKPGMDLGEYVNAMMGEAATESAFINHKDEYFNIDKWQRKKNQNILYITGLSGSGKSTLGEELSKSHDAFYIELDRIFHETDVDAKWNPDGYQKNVTRIFMKMHKELDITSNRDINNRQRQQYRIKAFEWLLNYCNERPELLFIWEGISIMAKVDVE